MARSGSQAARRETDGLPSRGDSSPDSRDHRHSPRVRLRSQQAQRNHGLTQGAPCRDCGFSHASTTVVQKALKARTALSAHPFVDAVSLQEFSDPRESVQEDVAFLREHPLVHPDSKISGWVYRVSNGELLRAC